jgi:hypothetical protein
MVFQSERKNFMQAFLQAKEKVSGRGLYFLLPDFGGF